MLLWWILRKMNMLGVLNVISPPPMILIMKYIITVLECNGIIFFCSVLIESCKYQPQTTLYC